MKSAKILIVSCMCLLFSVLVTGCGNWVDTGDIEKALKLCEGNGGLRHLSIFASDTAVCNNGAEFERNEWMVEKGK